VRIDRLEITNFKRFASREFTFHPQFNLIVGENATGKTSVLDGLSIAVDGWFLGLRGAQTAGGIGPEQVHVVPHQFADSVSFEKQFTPAPRIEASGQVMGQDLTWSRELSSEKGRTTTFGAKKLIDLAREADRKTRVNEVVTLPMICCYGVERLWFESAHRKSEKKRPLQELPSRFDGYRDCTNFEIQETDLLEWIRKQQSVGYARKAGTIALEVMKQAIASCVEFASDFYYDELIPDLILGTELSDFQMFSNLSAGQRLLLTQIGDLARRVITLNPHLGRDVLQQTPGIVMIDELDLHLHPKWQRRIIEDLRRIFPKIQFIVTTHSPFLIQSLRSGEELVMLDGQPTAELGNKSLEEIASGIMEVSNPQVSVRYERMKGVAQHYLKTLDEAQTAPKDKLEDYKAKLSEDIAPYADNPAFQAFLEMKRVAKIGE
jgi:predicted ATP-binding protein involved in virulence